MAASPERAIIRHPLLWRPCAAAPPGPLPSAALSLALAPQEVLLHVAGYLDSARDLLSFAAVCSTTR